MTTRATRRVLSTWIVASAAIALVTGCAGGIGGQSGQTGEGGQGFEYGADQDTVDAAIADLEPVTLKYQSPAASESAVIAQSTLQFKDYVEERSGGKITIEVVWGPAVAAYSEVDDALVDGRLDIAYTLPIYNIAEYSSLDALSTLSAYAPSSPLSGEAASYAMLSQLAWESDALLEEFSGKGLEVLSPLTNTGQYGTWCTSEEDGLDAWKGNSVSVSTAANNEIVDALGGAPTFLEFTETFEALERNTVSCAMINQPVAASGGIVEVAPHLIYSNSGSPSKVSGSNVAGSSFATLPLAYQQILFDSEPASFDGWLQHIEKAIATNIETIESKDGSVNPLSVEAQRIVDETQDEIVQQHVDEGNLTTEQVEQAQELAKYWTDQAAEVGLEDKGTLADFSDWYTPDEVDFAPLGERLFDEVFIEHRPSA